jgi:hypothetical protein
MALLGEETQEPLSFAKEPYRCRAAPHRYLPLPFCLLALSHCINLGYCVCVYVCVYAYACGLCVCVCVYACMRVYVFV